MGNGIPENYIRRKQKSTTMKKTYKNYKTKSKKLTKKTVNKNKKCKNK